MAATIARHRMLVPGQRVLAAFSGGADSTALALLLTDLGYRVVLAHVDHGMRPDSHLDAQHCTRVAADLGLQLLTERVQVDPPTQAGARQARYAALETMARRAQVPAIATGHTLDDEAETVSLRLGRGGFGLGIPPVRETIVRPLLGIARSTTEQVCAQAGVPYLTDPSNRNLKFRRVAVRTALAQGPRERVAGLVADGKAARAQAEVVAREVQRVWPDLVEVSPEGSRVDRAGFQRQPEPVRRQLVHRLTAGHGIQMSRRAVQDVLGKVAQVTGAALDLPGGWTVWSEREQIVLGIAPAGRAPAPARVRVPGVSVLPEWGLRLCIEPVETPEGIAVRNPDPAIELVDAAALSGEVVVRGRRPGDRFHPLGAPGTRKLQDFFVDRAVPRNERSQIPLLVAGDRIVWVVGQRLDHRCRVEPRTGPVLRLQVAAAGAEQVA